MTDLARRILDLHRAGKSYLEIAEQAQCHPGYARKALHRLGLLPIGKRGLVWEYER